MTFDRTIKKQGQCPRCGGPTAVEIQLRAAARGRGRPANKPAHLGSKSATLCESCAEGVFDAMAAVLRGKHLP